MTLLILSADFAQLHFIVGERPDLLSTPEEGLSSLKKIK